MKMLRLEPTLPARQSNQGQNFSQIFIPQFLLGLDKANWGSESRKQFMVNCVLGCKDSEILLAQEANCLKF